MTVDNGGVVAKYLRYREVQRALNRRLATMIPKTGLKECAERLDYWRNGMMEFEQEDDISVLFDFAIYDYRIRGGTNAVERLAKQSKSPKDSDEHVVLDAMLRARFTLLSVLDAIPDVGARVSDLVYEREFLLTEVGLSNTATAGRHIAARVLEFPEFQMTTGAALPFDPELAGAVVDGLRRAFPEGLPIMLPKFRAAERSKLAAYVIRIAMADPDDVMEALPE